jgi:predicted nuclease with TOPRIM domain
MTREQRKVWRYIGTALGIAFFFFAAYLVANDKPVSGTAIVAGIGIILLLFTNLEQIESFKGLGIEAKTRELKETISDAERILGELESVRGKVKALADDLRGLQESGERTKDELQQKLTELDARASEIEQIARSARTYALMGM